MSLAYKKAGVDIAKGDRFVGLIGPFAKKTQGVAVKKVKSGYAGLYQTSPGHYIAATTDGVGTKLKLAFQTGVHHTIGQDLVAMSVNDLICVGAEPHFFLDYFATGQLKLNIAAQVLKGIAAACQKSGMALIGGETAEMPGFYKKGEYDLAGFAVGTVTKATLLDGSRVRAGDVLIGLASSGFHSNGYSLVRKHLGAKEKNLKAAALKPTVLYTGAAHILRSHLGTALHGMSHITGGGFLNIPRLNESYDYHIDLDCGWHLPPVIRTICERSRITNGDAFQTFNMGVGLVIAVEAKVWLQKGGAVLRDLAHKKYDGFHLGTVAKKKKRQSRVIVVGRYLGNNQPLELVY
jgi:phosphoribosylformylglycinamidine cyclo-ligase